MALKMRLFLLQAVHLAIVIACVWAIAYLLYRGAAGGGGGWLAVAAAMPGAIGIGRYLNGVECILQSWARQWQGVEKGRWARDILWLPERWAMRIPSTFTPLYLLGLGLVAGRALERAGFAG
jgi:hypothetical protein